MPGCNQKGPQGNGPATGGGRGNCVSAADTALTGKSIGQGRNQAGAMATGQGQGSGQGRGAGQGCGQGRGAGQGGGRCRAGVGATGQGLVTPVKQSDKE